MSDQSLGQVLDRWTDDECADQQVEWLRTLLLAIEQYTYDDPSEVPLSAKQSWILLSYCEEATALAVREQSVHILSAATKGVLLTAHFRAIDTRECLLVGALIRRATALLGLECGSVLQHYSGDQHALELLGQFPAAVSPRSHKEVGCGTVFRFERVPLTTISGAELLRRLRK